MTITDHTPEQLAILEKEAGDYKWQEDNIGWMDERAAKFMVKVFWLSVLASVIALVSFGCGVFVGWGTKEIIHLVF